MKSDFYELNPARARNTERNSLMLPLIIVAIVYVMVMALTGALAFGDTLDYVDSIKTFNEGGDYKFWEFGHLFWRPLGWLCARILAPFTQMLVGSNTVSNITLTLVWINWVFGLLSALFLVLLLRTVSSRASVIAFVASAFVLTQAFLNYAQTGCSYVPGLAMLILGMYFLARDNKASQTEIRTAALAGSAFALSICFWFLYIWALPAAVLTGLFLRGFNRRQWRTAIFTCLIFTLITAIAYGAVLAHLGISNVSDLKHWISPTGAPPIRGVSRMLFGFARSFINMGNDGALLKRYLIKDPLNPVSTLEIFRASLWKFLLFYLFLAAVVVDLWRTGQGKKILGLLAIGAVFVIGFAVVFLGGDPERYFPLYPMLLLGVCYSLSAHKRFSVFNYVAIGFLAVMIIINSFATANVLLVPKQESSATRLRELEPGLKPGSMVFTANWQDELVNFSRSYPFEPVNQNPNLRINAIITPGAPWLPQWQADFARVALEAWSKGGDVWISKRAFAARPEAEWNWVEGDDKRISWNELPAFLKAFEFGNSTPSNDGFVMLVASDANKSRLESLQNASLIKAK